MSIDLPAKVPGAARHRAIARHVDEEHGRAVCGECGYGLHVVNSSLASWRRWWRHDPRRPHPAPEHIVGRLIA